MASQTKNTATAKVAPTAKTATKKAPKKAAAKPAVAKKPAAKKTSKKASTTKSNKRQLVIATRETAFWVNNGEVLFSLVDLRDSLPGMTARVYRYHADYEQHDFALWVEHVLLDPQCAAALRAASSVTAAEAVVIKYLKRYAL